jgi:four helix bundle protein
MQAPQDELYATVGRWPTMSYYELRVWQEAMNLTTEIYRSTAGFPRHELYGLTQQMRRAAVSIPSNIAEGKGHRSDRELSHFLFHARGSLFELRTQLMIAQRLEYLTAAESKRLGGLTDEVGRDLNALINSVYEKAS